MKTAVYLHETGELLGVVDVDAEIAERMKHGGFWHMGQRMTMRAIDYSKGMDDFDMTCDRIEFRFVPIYTGKGQTLHIVVKKREDLESWPKQLWPRRRKERSWKLPKSDRRARAQSLGTQYRLHNPNAFRRG